MFRLALLILLAIFAAPTLAGTFTIVNGTSGCTYDKIVVSGNGDGVATCVTGNSTPVPPVTPPPVNPPPVGSLCVVSANRNDFPPPGSSSPPLMSQIGVVNTWKLPSGGTCKRQFGVPMCGTLQVNNEYSGTPKELRVEWSVSRCAGDFKSYKDPANWVAPSARAPKQAVCGGIGATPGGSWGIPGSCPIPVGEQWFLNIQYLDGAQPGVTYSVSVGVAL